MFKEKGEKPSSAKAMVHFFSNHKATIFGDGQIPVNCPNKVFLSL
jgi:hypothetical protein